ncbi:MAG TPA: hypothetical protein VGC63_09120 [Solirubrobacterales bacterium]
MSRAKLLLLSALVVSALGTTFSASAQATPEWWVEGGLIKTAEKLAAEVKVPELITFQTSALTVKCSKLQVTGGFVRPENKNSAESLVFSGCEVPGDAKCVVENIKTTAQNFPLQGTKGAISLNFVPTSGAVIAAFNITGCENKATSGKKTIKSNAKTGIGMKCEYPDVEMEQVNHKLNFNATSGSELEMENGLKTESLSFIAIVEWALATAKKWSAL